METINLHTVRDERGALTVAEKLPFEARRVYFLHDCTASRGGHAQRTVDRLMMVPTGVFRVRWRDKKGCGEHLMDDPSIALRVPPMTWLELSQFSRSAVCLVVASAEYDESDSIRDFQQFVRESR